MRIITLLFIFLFCSSLYSDEQNLDIKLKANLTNSVIPSMTPLAWSIIDNVYNTIKQEDPESEEAIAFNKRLTSLLQREASSLINVPPDIYALESDLLKLSHALTYAKNKRRELQSEAMFERRLYIEKMQLTLSTMHFKRKNQKDYENRLMQILNLSDQLVASYAPTKFKKNYEVLFAFFLTDLRREILINREIKYFSSKLTFYNHEWNIFHGQLSFNVLKTSPFQTAQYSWNGILRLLLK